MDFEAGKALFEKFENAFQANDLNVELCDQLSDQLKLMIFSGGSDSPEKKAFARAALELAALVSVRKCDTAGFERHVAQLRLFYTDEDLASSKSEKQNTVLGLYLLNLLAADRIGEFHRELELIDDHENKFINYPIELERYHMEGNYAKVLSKSKDVPDKIYLCFMERLLDTVRMKVGASMERSYEHLPAEEAAKMLMLEDIGELRDFAKRENEQKDSEDVDTFVNDATPSFPRNRQVRGIRWEVKDNTIYFVRPAEKLKEVPAIEIMINTISYATDLERIV